MRAPWKLRMRMGLIGSVLFAVCAAAAVERGSPWPVHVIDSGISGPDGVRLGDVDGDGDQDVSVGWEEDGTTRLYLNPGPGPQVRERWEMIECGIARNVEDAMIMDVDGDGQFDVVSCTEGDDKQIKVHFAPDSGSYSKSAAWKTDAFPKSMTGDRRWMFSIPMDVNEDGHLDIVAGGKSEGSHIAWLEAPAHGKRDLSRWTYHELSGAGWIMSLIAHDMDGDGDLDIVTSDRREVGEAMGLRWLSNPGTQGNQRAPWISHFISPEGDHPDFIDLADLDGDGDVDIVAPCKDPNRIDWYERMDASGLKWRAHEIAFPQDVGNSKAIKVGDMNLDGQLDLALSCASAEGLRSGVVWLEFDSDPRETRWTAHEISGPSGIKYDRIELIDLDGDGDLDLMTTEENFGPQSDGMGVIWYENPLRR